MAFEINCFDSQGGTFKTSMSFDFTDRPLNEVEFARSVRVELNHIRQATSSTKSRGEVSFSNKKPWKQKGTGRARCGDAASPHWRKGGVAFGPTPGCRRLKINKKERKNVLGMMLKSKLESGDFFGFELPENGLCSSFSTLLKKVGLSSQRILFLFSSKDTDTIKSVRNLSNVDVAFFDQLGTLDLSKKNIKFAFLVKEKELLQEVFDRWT